MPNVIFLSGNNQYCGYGGYLLFYALIQKMIYPAYILLYWFDHLAFSSYHDNKSECLHRNRNRHVLSFVPKYHKNILRIDRRIRNLNQAIYNAMN